jgi:hypothetical protein
MSALDRVIGKILAIIIGVVVILKILLEDAFKAIFAQFGHHDCVERPLSEYRWGCPECKERKRRVKEFHR